MQLRSLVLVPFCYSYLYLISSIRSRSCDYLVLIYRAAHIFVTVYHSLVPVRDEHRVAVKISIRSQI